jgi:glycosyltransferase involved in cell wall biosynthesis
MSSRIAASLAQGLTERGHSVDVVTGFPNYPTGKIYPGYSMKWRQIEEEGQIRTIRVPLYPSHSRSAVGRMANFASFGAASTLIGVPSLRKADVAYVYHPPITTAFPAMALRLLKRVPFVLHVQDMWPESVIHSGMGGSNRVGSVLSAVCSAVYRAASEIVVISPGFKELLCERGVPADKISVVPNWVNEGLYGSWPADSAERRLLGPDDARIVLYGGNLGEFQGLDAAILAAERVGPRLHLALVGDGIARERLEDLIKQRDIRNVTILPSRPESEMPRLLAAADAHLVKLQDLPFFASTIPGKTQVALSSGRAVVMAVRGDAARIVDDAGCGLTCAPDIDGLTSAFTRIVAMPQAELTGMGQAGRQYYEMNFSFANATEKIEQSLCRAANR